MKVVKYDEQKHMVAGQIKSATGKTYDVVWDESRQVVYVVSKAGFLKKASKTQIGKANSAAAAMRKAHDYLSNY